MEKKKVIIVGGGYGGVYCSKLLDDKFDVTLIERKQLFFHNITALRLIIEPELCLKVFIPMDKLLKKGRVIYQLVTKITSKTVVLDDGKELEFDYLVVATGSNNMTPFKSPTDTTQLYKYYTELAEKVKKANSIAIIGGTTIGCELAGEIASAYPGKPITIVQNISRLCSHRLGEKFSGELVKKLEKIGVKVMLNTLVEIPSEAVVNRNQMKVVDYPLEKQIIKSQSTEGEGFEFEAELIFYCLANRPNSEPLREEFSESIDNVGQLMVNENMQVQGYNNIFALGDITNVNELKTAYNALFHAKVIAKNIELLESTDQKKRLNLIKHNPTYPMLFISIGKKKGVSSIPGGIILGNFLTKLIKSKHTFISSCRKLLNNPKTIPEIGQPN